MSLSARTCAHGFRSVGASPPPGARIARGAAPSLLLGILSDVFIGADVRPWLSQCGRQPTTRGANCPGRSPSVLAALGKRKPPEITYFTLLNFAP